MSALDQACPHALTADVFLGGKLRILQPASGYRAGIDAVLLAGAAGAAGAADRPIRAADLGAGAGTAGLCLAARLPNAEVTLIEREPDLVGIANENIALNGFGGRVRAIQYDVTATGAIESFDILPESFDWVIANPPYNEEGSGTLSSDPFSAGANAMPPDALDQWVRFMTRLARPGGHAVMINRADSLPRLLAAFDRRFGALQVLPLHPRAGVPANRVILTGTKGSKGPLTLRQSLMLYGPGPEYLPAIEAVLRRGAALLDET